MTNRMLTICPTYRRPGMAEDMIKSFQETKGKQVDLVLGLSKNDPCIPEYMQLSVKYNVAAEVFDTNSTTVIFNELAKKYPDYYCYHMTNDDVIYKTKFWDFVFIDVLLQQGGGITFGNDLFHSAQLCTLPIISADVVKALGWLQYPLLDKLFGDAIWMNIGIRVPCIYYHPQMIMEHKHWINKKRENDVTGEEYLVGYKKDEFLFNFWLTNHVQRDVDIVKGVLKHGKV